MKLRQPLRAGVHTVPDDGVERRPLLGKNDRKPPLHAIAMLGCIHAHQYHTPKIQAGAHRVHSIPECVDAFHACSRSEQIGSTSLRSSCSRVSPPRGSSSPADPGPSVGRAGGCDESVAAPGHCVWCSNMKIKSRSENGATRIAKDDASLSLATHAMHIIRPNGRGVVASSSNAATTRQQH